MKRVRSKFNKAIACLCLGATMALSGLFFVGCGDNPADRLTLTPDKSVVEVFAGESENVTFTIGNYTNGIDTSLNFALVDSTIASTKGEETIRSEHSELTVVNHDGTQTTVKITGLSGGKTTLVAKTNEGDKKTSVEIVVKQYSSKFELKDDTLLYVSKSTPFIPSEKLFNFDDSATERKVSFHFTDALSKANDNNAFVKAELVKENDSDAYSVVFYQEDGYAVVLDDYKNMLEGAGISIIARYYNPQTDKTESEQFSLTVLYGFDEGVKIEAYDGEDQVENIELVTNDPGSDTENWRSKKFKVRVPHVENIEGGENVKFDVVNAQKSLISVQKVKNLTESTENYDVYDFEVVSTAVASNETYITLRLYYQIDGISYADSGDASVEQHIVIPVRVRIAPSKIVVNSTEQTSADNQYDFYNHYDGDFGWKEFKVDVYDSDSSFDHVLMTFDNDLIVKYKNKTYTAGVASYQLKIDDVKQTIYVRGASDAAETQTPKQIKFEVISEYAREIFSYECNYSILTGATRLEYDNPNTNYEYKPSQEATGVFVSSSKVSETFTHLVTDSDFKYATVTYYEGEEGQGLAARVIYDGKEDYEASEFGKIVKLKITPLKEGKVTYKITLDNGVSKLVTFRVVDTFDNLSINLAGYGNGDVQSTEKVLEGKTEGYDDEMKVVIQNTVKKDKDGQVQVTYDKNATLVLGSASGDKVFGSVSYTISNSDVVSVSGDDKTFVLKTSTYGEGYVDFKAIGTYVDDFKITTITRHAKANFVSFVPVSSLSVKYTDDSGNEVNANNVSLYVGNMVDAKLQEASFTIKVDPENMAYGFLDPETNTMQNENYNPQYVYWTIGSGAAPYLDNKKAENGRMVYGQIYKIGSNPSDYFGTFDTTTNKFTINKNKKDVFSFTMFASIKQYGVSKYFSVTIKGEAYDFVERIYTNLGENKLSFSPLKQEYDVGVFLNPTNATDTEIKVFYESKNAENDAPILINEDDIVIKNISSGISLVTVKLNSEVLKAPQEKLSGVLKIIPNAWYVNESVIAGYENSIIEITIVYEDGTEANPFSLNTAEDVVAIGSSEAAMKAHYKISTIIDLSAYASKLPLGGNMAFSGSIVGTEGAAITGINISNGTNGNYGLFNTITGKISSLTLEGKFNINQSEGDINVGLLCASTIVSQSATVALNNDDENETPAYFENISVRILGGTIKSSGKVVFGGLIGNSDKKISDMSVIFEDFVTITTSIGNSNQEETVKAGGIVGTSSGDIIGRKDISKRFGLSAYSVYALIRVGDVNQTVPQYGAAAAVVASQTGKNVTNILAGGVIFAKNVGGIVETFEGDAGNATNISDLTIRTQIRGQDVGLIAVNAKDEALNNEFKNISVQATDDGESTGIYASMFVKLKQSLTEEKDIQLTEEKEINYNKLLLPNSPSMAANGTTFSSYVNRNKIDISKNGVDAEYDIDNFFGDAIFVSVGDNCVVRAEFFTPTTTSFDVEANEAKGFKKLTNKDKDTSENVIFAYYFEAAGYYGANGFTTEQSQDVQEILDKLNHVKIDGQFYPIKVTSLDISISSNSPLVEVSANGDLYIKGTGLAELQVSSLLNQKQNESVYLYIINYFNVDSYLKNSEDRETGIFTLGDLVLGQESEFKVYANAGVDVLISPSYKYNNFVLEDDGIDLSVNISRDGLVKIGNDLIQLKKNRSVSASVVGEMKYGTSTSSRDGITFTKNGKVGEGQTDTVTLKATMSQVVNGETYSLDITTLENVVINYYEGAKEIKSLSNSYVLSSSVAFEDAYLIDSDDDADQIDEGNCVFVDAESGEKTELFVLDLTEDGNLKYKAQISVNKDSDEFKNRFKENIYKDYILKLKATSNADYVKEIKIKLVQENVDVIAFTNYRIISTDNGSYGLEEYSNIIPGSRGVLSVALSPMDADFDYLQITNNEMNKLEGASQGTFVLGTWSDSEGFKSISGSEYVNGGVRISKYNLESALENFEGQIYVRYTFSNKDVEDSTPVGIDITVLQTGGEITRTAQYNFYKKDDVLVSLKGFTNKQYVARGLEYELDVRAIGYDPETITLVSSMPQQAAIDERDGRYFLSITNDTIQYRENEAGLSFTLTLSASKIDDMGEVSTETSDLSLTILDYVINYDNKENNESGDIVNGVENSVLNIAVGDKKQLAITFDGLVEYNTENANVEIMVNAFLNSLSTKGTWAIYTDLNYNNASGESSKNLPIDTENSTKSIISASEEFNIKYLKISDLGLTTIQSHNPDVARRYFFTYNAAYSIKNGKYECSGDGDYSIKARFDVYSYLRGSDESPNPIRTYSEFLKMEPGGYYIQLEDISVPADEFEPLNTAIRYFDGNGYSFIFEDPKYNIKTASSVGLFGTVNSDTVLKNITIQVKNAEFNSEATSAINFGFVAGTNSGSITNAKVVSDGDLTSLTFKNTPSTEGYYFGGIVGQNIGYITHCQSQVVISSLISMGGVVGSNQGTVASSMFKGGKLTNDSVYNAVFGVGGVAATNSENAVIITSYSSGDIESDCMYANDTTGGSKITSSVPLGGFIYLNEGTIRDCYSNIPLATSSRCSGFAFNNNGRILRSFSTSKIINDNSATNYYFAGEGIGTFEDCYYITGNKINRTLSPLTHDGVEPLRYDEEVDANGNVTGKVTLNEFGEKFIAEKFANYSYSNSPSYNSVWFYSDGSISNSIFPGQSFADGRLELTSANITANSRKELVKTTVNSDGIATYVYVTASGYPEDGSVFNPYVIYSPETMEGYFVTNNKVASGNYRLICPLDYSTLVSDYSQLYKVTLKGNFEANNMSITGITLSSSDQLDYAGLFGSIAGAGTGINAASIMNFNLTPREVVFKNAAEVGTIAGRIQNANLYNINVYGASAGADVDVNDEIATVTGKNIVGGVIGLAKGGYNIKNVRSLIGAFAVNVPADTSNIDYENDNKDYSKLSFAGGIAGYLAETGNVQNVTVERAAVNVIGGKAGFIFGGLSSGATAKDIYLKFNSSMRMKPYRYAGFIAGEIKGKLQNAYVYGYSTGSDGTENIFSLKPYTATAIGGIAGMLSGGEIDTAYISQGLAIANEPTASVEINTVNYVGGIVGYVKGNGNKISKVVTTGDWLAKNTLGGIVGQVASGAAITISEAAVKSSDLTIEGQIASPAIGGIVGSAGEQALVNISNSYSWANITIKAYTYSTDINAAFGGIIGKTVSETSDTSKNTSLYLTNIYTTSIYNITLEDKSSTDATGMVYDGWVENNNGGRNYRDGNNLYGYYLDGDGGTLGEIDGDDDSVADKLRQINYSLSQTTTSCSNVYNSSIYSAIAGDLATIGGIMDKGYTTLLARRFQETKIEVKQNEYGVDLLSLNGGGSSNTYPEIVPPVPNRIDLNTAFEAFYKEDPYGLGEYNKKPENANDQKEIPNSGIIQMFKNNSVWKNPGDTFAYLAFEENLKLS